ncbi:hypothetical protein A2716_00850 [candidate division WWE3 bacterium RIFCSPHIGHO2_01_FULL_40_23]|uniref:Uncharacterized protein n=1 Tax=candidate division WWE3 bacterium RIFCSPLOWO2_01_FULL_41_18 TaxID=1802625 RepID=A0A1F4VEF5_UNCKA|nr:MAG: hypothetical protein A2716_00850 [candidate division WWE3 bacterium RIFCSPHIGHO2_01_FULL_40_23]OGC55539.1 MAG: hypothetical protein A3A78_01120 [candidate division WWE3 bacterium RIFCSPLOWO2_01_FULL_41_18]
MEFWKQAAQVFLDSLFNTLPGRTVFVLLTLVAAAGVLYVIHRGSRHPYWFIWVTVIGAPIGAGVVMFIVLLFVAILIQVLPLVLLVLAIAGAIARIIYTWQRGELKEKEE